MKRIGVAFSVAAGVLASAATTASAADLAVVEPAPAVAVPSLFDVGFGVAGVTDYRIHGVTQTNRRPAVQGYVELQAFDWLYAGVWGSNVKFPSTLGMTNPSGEVDFYAGIRHSWGAFSLDASYLYYWYPNETKTFPGQKETDFWEIKAFPTFAIGEYGSITGSFAYSPDFINTGADEFYVGVQPKVNIPVSAFPNLAFYIAGEIGKQWIKKADNGFDAHDFLYWNVGGGVNYKAMTLDVRYMDTDLSKGECAVNTLKRNWCGSTVVGKLSFDTSFSKLK